MTIYTEGRRRFPGLRSWLLPFLSPLSAWKPNSCSSFQCLRICTILPPPGMFLDSPASIIGFLQDLFGGQKPGKTVWGLWHQGEAGFALSQDQLLERNLYKVLHVGESSLSAHNPLPIIFPSQQPNFIITKRRDERSKFAHRTLASDLRCQCLLGLLWLFTFSLWDWAHGPLLYTQHREEAQVIQVPNRKPKPRHPVKGKERRQGWLCA